MIHTSANTTPGAPAGTAASAEREPERKPTRRKKWWILGGVVVVLGGLQLFGPSLQNPPVDPALTFEGRLPTPPNVRHVLQTACMDCHSHATDWPWFAHIAPVSMLAANTVAEGREHLNFSAWGSYTSKKQEKLLDEISTVTRFERMPLPLYKITHPDARLSTNDRFILYFWARNQIARVRMERQAG